MKESNKQDVETLMGILKDDNIEKETESIQANEADPLFSLKNVLFDFFKSRLISINKEDGFKNRVKQAILDKIEEDEVSVAQLINLYVKTSEQSSIATGSLLDIFKPSKEGSVSPLLQRDQNNQLSSFGDQDISPDQAEALNVLTEIVSKINSKVNTPKKEQDIE